MGHEVRDITTKGSRRQDRASIDQGGDGICKLCKKRVPSKGSCTSGLNRHAKIWHSKEWSEINAKVC